MGGATVRGGTSAMVETGSAGASRNTPASSFDFGQGFFLILRRGVHRIRTITTVYRPEGTRAIGYVVQALLTAA